MNDLGPPTRPAWFDVLLAGVDRALEATGADTAGWPDPHPDRSPLDEEYSRVSDPGKYRILDARVDAWVQVLAEAVLAKTRDVPAKPWIGALRPPAELLRVRRIKPVRPGGLTLLLAATLIDAAPFGLDVAVALGEHRPVFLGPVPTCGCDACDSGSADLLATLDGWLLAVARGGVLHARSGSPPPPGPSTVGRPREVVTCPGWTSRPRLRRESSAGSVRLGSRPGVLSRQISARAKRNARASRHVSALPGKWRVPEIGPPARHWRA